MYKMYNIAKNVPGFSIGKLEIAWYAIIIVTGMLLALFVLSRIFKKKGIEPDFALTVFLYTVPLAIIFARLGYVVGRSEYYPINSWAKFVKYMAIWEGGLTITTAVIGGALGVFLACLRHKKSFFRVTDLIIPSLLIGQIIGRWGNFVNGELYGKEVLNETMHFFPFAVNIYGTWHYALFFYEGFFNFIFLIVVLILIFKKIPKFDRSKYENISTYKELVVALEENNKDLLPIGTLTFLYLSWYPFLRGMLEFLKEKGSKYEINGYGVIQVISLIVSPLMLLIFSLLIMRFIKFETDKMKIRHFSLDKQQENENN